MKVGIVEKEMKKMQDQGFMPMEYNLKHARLMGFMIGLAGLLILALIEGTWLVKIPGIWMTVCGFLVAVLAHRENWLKEEEDFRNKCRLLD